MWDLSSPARDQTCTPYIGKQILNHWTTREVPFLFLFFIIFIQMVGTVSASDLDQARDDVLPHMLGSNPPTDPEPGPRWPPSCLFSQAHVVYPKIIWKRADPGYLRPV